MVIAGDELKTPSYSPAVSGLANKNHRSRHAWRSRQPNITINTILAVVTAQQGAVLTTVAAQQGTVLTTVAAQQGDQYTAAPEPPVQVHTPFGGQTTCN